MTIYLDGEECSHPGCRNHISHPCEGCGRIGAVGISDTEIGFGSSPLERTIPELQKLSWLELRLKEIFPTPLPKEAAFIAGRRIGKQRRFW